MVHFAALIRRSFFKVYAAIVLVFLVLAGSVVFYIGQNQKQYTVSRSFEALLASREEAANTYIQFVAGRPLPPNPNPKFFSWMEHRPRLLGILPDMGITLDSIEKSGRLFYEGLRPKLPQNTNSNVRAVPIPPNPTVVAQQYEAFKNNIDTLVTPLSNYTYKPTSAEARLNGAVPFAKRFTHFLESAAPVLLGMLCLLLLLTVFWASQSLGRRFRRQSDGILDLLWSALKEQSAPSETQVPSPEYLQNNIYILAGESGTLVRRLEELREVLSHMPAPLVQAPPSAQGADAEQVSYIQKLLARLFTRAERVAALAKASAGNGAQAGILALNISIEAARAGDAGRPFLAGADKIKDFGEKTSRIGEAILEEMKDADTSIRKAYAVGKTLLDAAPAETKAPSSPPPDWENALRSAEDVMESALRVQETARAVERGVEDLAESLKYRTEEPVEDGIPVQEAVLKSFELLYFLSRGDVPPTHILKNG